MSNQIITDYMAGRIGDKYYEHQCNEAAGLVIEIDDTDNGNRYRLDRGGAKNFSIWPSLSNFDHFEREVQNMSDVGDDEDCITDITQVQPGDIEVAKSGNRYKVVENDSASDVLKLKVNALELGDYEPWLRDSEFAYALRQKHKVPTESGLYQDCDGRVWELITGTGCWQLSNTNRFMYPTLQSSEVLDPSFAPYTRIDLGADNE